MDDLNPNEMRRRIRELLAIPDRDRTDKEWDELNELEIRTAPGNRDPGNRDNSRFPDRFSEKRPNNNQQPRRQDRGQPRTFNATGNNQRSELRPPQVQQEGGPGVSNGAPRQENRQHPKRQHRRPKKLVGDRPANDVEASGSDAPALQVVSSPVVEAPNSPTES